MDYSSDTRETAPLPGPASIADLFISFTLIALQGFGGVMPIVQREIVEKKRWVTNEEFLEDWSVAQITPGPNVINLSVIMGGRYFGLPGAIAAMSGLVMVPLLFVLLLAYIYAGMAEDPGSVRAMRGVGAVVAAMFAATGLKLASALKNNVLGMPLCIMLGTGCFAIVALLRGPLILALLGPGTIACVLVYRKIQP